MKKPAFLLRLAAALLVPAAMLCSCEDDISGIGNSFASGEVVIERDSSFTVTGKTVLYPDFDARSSVKLVGALNVPEYGSMRASFLSQMLASTQLGIPDSIGVERVDSMKMIVSVRRTALTGDSLAPQQLRIYRLNKQLPAGENFVSDPSQYYSKSDLIGQRSYTLSMLGRSDSLYKKSTFIEIPVPMSLDFARQVFNDYRSNPAVFQWPQSFNEYFKGIYVEPSFGRSCVANVSTVAARMYYHRRALRQVKEDTTYLTKLVNVPDSVTVFSTAPEVTTVNHLDISFSDGLISRIDAGENIIVTPTGYNIDIRFPLPELLKRYQESDKAMTVLDNLLFTVPAEEIKNDYGITTAPYMLMVKTSELQEFFSKNKAPDGETSFWSTYDPVKGEYQFDSMRKYLLNAIEKGEELQESDYHFTLVPISTIIQYRTIGYNQTEPFVAACTPYLEAPSMTLMHIDRAKVLLTFSRQKIN